MTSDWKQPSVRALLPVIIYSANEHLIKFEGDQVGYWLGDLAWGDLIADDRPVTPSWWPPQEGDVVLRERRTYERGVLPGDWYNSANVNTGYPDTDMIDADLIVRDGERYPPAAVTP